MSAGPVDADAMDAGTAEAVATAFVRALARGAWDDAAALATLAVPPDAEPADFLRDLWTGLVAQLGEVQSGRVAASAPHGSGRAVDVAGRFANAAVVLRVIVGPAARVVGFWATTPLRPAAPDGAPPDGTTRGAA